MYIYVTVQEKDTYYRDGPAGRVKARLEQASGERCLIVPYQEFDMAAVNRLNPRALAMSGFGGHFQSRQVEWFLGMDEVLHNADLPHGRTLLANFARIVEGFWRGRAEDAETRGWKSDEEKHMRHRSG